MFYFSLELFFFSLRNKNDCTFRTVNTIKFCLGKSEYNLLFFSYKNRVFFPYYRKYKGMKILIHSSFNTIVHI